VAKDSVDDGSDTVRNVVEGETAVAEEPAPQRVSGVVLS
jgi:hypothetical protein